MYIPQQRTRFEKVRDVIAFNIAAFAFNHIASQWYSKMIEGSLRLGMEAARVEAKGKSHE